jgi:hypothetical protein
LRAARFRDFRPLDGSRVASKSKSPSADEELVFAGEALPKTMTKQIEAEKQAA